MPVSQENEAVLKGRVAPKKQPAPDSDNDIEEEKEEGVKRPLRHDEVAMGVNGDIEKQFKLLGFAEQSSVPRH